MKLAAYLLPLLLFTHSALAADFAWRKVDDGYYLGRYELPSDSSVLRSEVILARFTPSLYSFHLSVAPRGERLKVTELVTKTSGIGGINASFFDEKGAALGIIVQDGQQKQRIHAGGKVLTGIFAMRGDKPTILHRSEYENADLAVQAGPRLIAGGRPLDVASPFTTTRRSGVAVTKSGEIIIYATALRFPGASLQQIQQMLLDPDLETTVEDALNLDGGGSSQLFLRAAGRQSEDILVTGGDLVPVALVVKKRR